jgi:hypothetical protein
MKKSPPSPLLRFLLGLVSLTPLCLGFWWFVGKDYLVVILEKGVSWITQWLMAGNIVGLTSQENIWLLQTSLSTLDMPLNLLVFPVFPTRVTVCFPLFWGLALATPGAARLRQILIGTLALLPMALVMLLALIQFKIALHINHQPLLTEAPQGAYVFALPYPDFLYQLMGVGRQMALLVLPTLCPLLVWGLLNRRFIRGVILEGFLARMTKQPIPKPAHARERILNHAQVCLARHPKPSGPGRLR